MAKQTDDRMYSIKLVHPKHLTYWFFTPDVHCDGRQRWMNFSNNEHARAIADGIPVGHRALVYVISVQRFVWAIEYTGTVQDGEQVATGSGLSPEWSKVFLPIRFLAAVGEGNQQTADEVLADADVSFSPNTFPMKYITADEYQELYDAIDWAE
jgi:hypothetical protein